MFDTKFKKFLWILVLVIIFFIAGNTSIYADNKKVYFIMSCSFDYEKVDNGNVVIAKPINVKK